MIMMIRMIKNENNVVGCTTVFQIYVIISELILKLEIVFIFSFFGPLIKIQIPQRASRL